MNKKENKREIAIKVENVSKSFRIPHEKIDTMKGVFVNSFKRKTFEEFNALDDVSFEVEKGEFFGVIGRNGSGKSTLLKILAGIYKQDKGRVKINGMISPFLELGIGFNPELSGRDNIYLNGTVLGLTKQQIDEKFNSIVEFSELERFIDQKLKNYSSGMQVRLAFSVSIHANRDILLMDEVLAVGDSNFQKKCIDIFKNYRREDKTVILVTHDISSVRKYCTKALLLYDGKIIKKGDVNKVCDEYVMKNMASEARIEMFQKQKTKKEEKKRMKQLNFKLKNKPQAIVDVNVFGGDGKELISMSRGDDFVVRIEVEIKETCENLNLVVQVLDMDNDYFISGSNTFVDGFRYKWKKGRNDIELAFKNNNLNIGEIYFKVMLFKRQNAESVVLDSFSSLDKRNFITIKKRNSANGILFMEHKWKQI